MEVTHFLSAVAYSRLCLHRGRARDATLLEGSGDSTCTAQSEVSRGATAHTQEEAAPTHARAAPAVAAGVNLLSVSVSG